MKQDAVLEKFIKFGTPQARNVEKIILFGSRARGNERPDSDYDLLLVVSEDFSRADKDILYDAVLDTLFETGKLVSLKIMTKQRFQQLKEMRTRFFLNVLKDGKQIA